jgi:hypothetical protein
MSAGEKRHTNHVVDVLQSEPGPATSQRRRSTPRQFR